MDLFLTGQGKLGLRSYNIASQARTLWANERLWEPERGRVSQSEPEWARVSQSESEWARVTVTAWSRVIQREPESAWLRNTLKLKLLQKSRLHTVSPKMTNLHSEPTPWPVIYPALLYIFKIPAWFWVPIFGKSRIFKLRMISADSAEWELVKLS